jgi:hypothetical protein
MDFGKQSEIGVPHLLNSKRLYEGLGCMTVNKSSNRDDHHRWTGNE